MSSPKILIAEDSRAIARVLQFKLNKSGFDTVIALDGRIAADFIDREEFALLVTDYQMPEMHGEDLCRHVRQSERNRDIPILMCSAKSFELNGEHLRDELGIFRVMLKPFSPKKIVAVIEERLKTQSALA